MSLKMRPDMVLIDLADIRTAIPAIEALLLDLPQVKVIGMAEEPDSHLIEAALRAGASGFALKSDSVDDLMEAFEGVKAGEVKIASRATGPLMASYIGILQHKRMRDASIIAALASAVEAKDTYTGGHAQRVAGLAGKIAAGIDPLLGQDEQLRFGFVLHDVGKIGVPEGILRKESALTPDEWVLMKTHPLIGIQIISPLALDRQIEDVVRHHHERWDGRGYPDGLAALEIPLGARIFSVADTFDAMTTDRPYRRGVSISDAIREIQEQSGKQFDPAAVDAFINLAERELA